MSRTASATLRLWDVETGAQVGSPLEGHTTLVPSVAFSPDGQHIVSGSKDQTVRITDTSTTEDSIHLLPNQYCRVSDDGWLLRPSSQRLFWVPSQFRAGMERPGARIIGQVQRLGVDTTQFVHGEEWTRVKEGGKIPEDI
ncbi:hypothetical protein PIIN_10365 [Serendipita indica DSM 11827]|uniref:Uncharacterized protein n=1 Tax=Serendipita indica (strain DSM 11827) TaxID=1109443 RepID=G4TYH9_SERID|nr:hypothetical protein PIIN_10365 [Serendipita indica DSM 11827]